MHRLIIDPRNKDEHDYQWPLETSARDGVDLSRLLVKAMQPIIDRGCIVSFGMSIMTTFHVKANRTTFTIDEIKGDPMLFVHAPHHAGAAMIIDPNRNEIQYCPLSDWDAVAENELAILLRTQLEMPNTGSSQWWIEHLNDSVLLDALYGEKGPAE